MAADRIKILKTKRGNIQRAVTKFANIFVEESVAWTKSEIKTRLSRIEGSYDDFYEVVNELEALDEATDLSIIKDDFDNKYYNAITLAREFLENSESENAPSVSSGVRLPELELPIFAGEYENWYKFKDTFNALIHKNNKLSNVQKHYYLNSCLKGTPSQLLSSLEISELNYEVAWSLLKERYENDKLIINSHVKAIFELPSVIRENYKDLRNLVDQFSKHKAALRALNQPVEYWDTLLIYLLTNKLDSFTRKAWETKLNTNEVPTIDDLIEFLANRCRILETMNINLKGFEQKENDKRTTKFRSHANLGTAKQMKCTNCQREHTIYKCAEFLDLSVDDRIKKARSLSLCLNCLKGNHYARECRADKCPECGAPHNKLLHKARVESVSETRAANETPQENKTAVTTHCNSVQTHVFLSTAIVCLNSNDGRSIKARALLDQGSDSNFVTREIYEKLGANNERNVEIAVTGIGYKTSKINKVTNLNLSSRTIEFNRNLDFLIIDNITSKVPAVNIFVNDLHIPKDIKLADPEFNIPAKVDVLLGAEIFYDLLKLGKIDLGENKPTLYNSYLGWLVTGRTCNNLNGTRVGTCNLTVSKADGCLENLVERFWNIEEISERRLTNEENYCETSFKETTIRDLNGRFVVRLPIKTNKTLGESFEIAKRRFLNLERKLIKNENLRTEYGKFMKEYSDLGHMVKIDTVDEYFSPGCPEKHYYIPHHCVFKTSSSTTKLRVVFDASAKTINGVSLNDTLRSGPVVQRDLFVILLNFRKYKFVLAGDIEKMYRQVLIHSDMRSLQRILWRDSVDLPMDVFELQTVTYGTTPASYLATRCLKELAIENELTYPNASRAIAEDFYMDDLLTGGDDVDFVLKLKIDIVNILKSGGFNLRKFVSNSNLILDRCVAEENIKHVVRDESETKTLGVLWDANSDILKYEVKFDDDNKIISKRHILSNIARIFDPLGLIAPIVVNAKILMQQLWQLRLDWDDELPLEVKQTWLNIQTHLEQMKTLKIPRWVLNEKYKVIELHGFSDASERAYGCVIYIRTITEAGEISVNLLCAKSRVAPMKSVSLPRLELCGALQLSRLMHVVRTEMKLEFNNIYYWTDSAIVLCWINGSPNKWKTFIANRVAEIQDLSEVEHWHHVSGSANPADAVSRGANAVGLSTSMWFTGPAWLYQEKLKFKVNLECKFDNKELEAKQNKTALVVNKTEEIFDKYSSFGKLVRVTAWMKRFVNNCRNTNKKLGSLDNAEISESTNILVRLVQLECFSAEIRRLKEGKSISNKSKLLPLNPFLDDEGIIRVGGRLKNSDLKYERKFPIVLPKGHTFTKLLINAEHIRMLHAGPQALLACIREKFWPLSGRDAVRGVIRKCITCFRAKPLFSNPMMGDLPKTRLRPVRPFYVCNVDYAGPFAIKDGKLRNRKFIKSYLCVFVCAVTRAVHLELVTDLSSKSFIDMLKRFVARRGIPNTICSDNATNFTAANRELREIRGELKILYKNDDFHRYLYECNIKWEFIPARSPHFGGLHEAAVKSAKFHLKRMLSHSNLTYEIMYTVLCQVEGVLNSRPLLPLSSDPSDLGVLTPGHFLIGSNLLALPDRDASSEATTLKSYARHQTLIQHFWKRWSKEFLNTLQTRAKWHRNGDRLLQMGQLVLLKEENIPVQQWKTGRVIELHPGTDGITRVATVKTATGQTRRAVKNLCPLPIED